MKFDTWLALREPADAAARATDLVEHLQATDSHVIHDLGCGTGSMARWLAPRLPGEQQWILHDRDAELLEIAAARHPSAETRQDDITHLKPADLTGATLITASALLDMLTEEELTRLVTVCAPWPTLLTLSVIGRVELNPADPLDDRVAAAFNDHQRRGRRLGPGAAQAAREQFERLGSQVITRPSPWRLDAAQQDLTAEWFRGWVGAACEQQPDLKVEAETYTRERLAQLSAGQLTVTVGHEDLLALPRSGG
jgi:methyltransferase family protein